MSKNEEFGVYSVETSAAGGVEIGELITSFPTRQAAFYSTSGNMVVLTLDEKKAIDQNKMTLDNIKGQWEPIPQQEEQKSGKFGVFQKYNDNDSFIRLIRCFNNKEEARQYMTSSHITPLAMRELTIEEVKKYSPKVGPQDYTLPQRTGANAIQHDGDHYKKMRVEVWDIVDDFPPEQALGYYRGNAIKYLKRLGVKDDAIVEAKKALHYCQKLIEHLEGQK